MAICYYITAREQFTGEEGDPNSARAIELLESKVASAYAVGIDYVQLREKSLSGLALAKLAERLASLPAKGNATLIVNGRIDVAVSCGADGVHFPAGAIPVSSAAQWLGLRGMMIGASCHGDDEARRAEEDGAHYVLLAPIFETPSKPGKKPLGLRVLENACRSLRIPVIALGGVTEDNAADCVRAGAAGVAGIRLFQNADDIAGLCRRLHSL